MHKTILELDLTAVIINYSTNNISNEYEFEVEAKETLLNCTRVILKLLIFLYNYFPNRYPSSKHIYSKFCIMCNRDINKVIIAIKDNITDTKFYSKC